MNRLIEVACFSRSLKDNFAQISQQSCPNFLIAQIHLNFPEIAKQFVSGPSCNSTGGWARIANLDMTDPNQNCPNGFRLVNRTESPLCLCGRPGNGFTGHVTVTFPTHGIEYTHVCGRVIGYQFGHTDAFLAYFSSGFTTIDRCYVDGIILTHGQSP